MEDLQGGTLALEHRYDLDRRVGDFALFTLYRGTQHPFDRPVWIKVCEAPAEFKTAALYDRIKRAVLGSAEIDHDRVAAVIDFGDIDKHVPFVVSERVEGISLGDYLESHGTLPPAEALEIARRVAETLHDLHRDDHIHGGLAPRWVAVADDGIFVDHVGLQPTMDEIRSMDGVMMSADLLWSLPPEQFRDDAVEFDERSDVWAIGALLYWMLSGVHPYFDDPSDTADAILRLRNATAPRPLEELGVEGEVSEFVERALDPDPDLRFPSIEALIEAHPLGGPEPEPEPKASEPVANEIPARPPEPQGGSLGTALAVSLVLLVLTNIGWLFYQTSTEPDPAPSVKSLPAAAPSVLPVGVQLRTEPAGAKVFRIDASGEEEFGDTPVILDPKARPENELPLVVRLPGRKDVRLDVTMTDDGHDVTVHLPAESEDEK